MRRQIRRCPWGVGGIGGGTVGQVIVSPNSRTVIPGEVRLSVAFRHPDEAEVDQPDTRFPREAGLIARACGVALDVTRLFPIAAQPFHPGCVDLVRQAVARLGYPAREIVSGAGHDAVYVAPRVPTAMIFTPCTDGLSHNEAESMLPEQAEAGGRFCSRLWLRERTGLSEPSDVYSEPRCGSCLPLRQGFVDILRADGTAKDG